MMLSKVLNEKLADTQKDLQAEIATLTEASTTAAAEIEDLKKKNEDETAKLRLEHASVVQDHVLASELCQQEVRRLEGEVLSLQQVASLTVSPRAQRVEDIPRHVLLQYLLNYMRTKEFEVTCCRLYGYFLAQGFSMLCERLYQRDPTLNLRDLRLFEGERMCIDGRTLL